LLVQYSCGESAQKPVRQLLQLAADLKIKDAHGDQLMRFIAKGGEKMLGWAVTFLIIALVAAVFGFGGIAAASAGIAKILFFLFLVMCVIFFVLGWRGRGAP
jgi:uncharacterized membrane protein YtjA (UPF0391 family)